MRLNSIKYIQQLILLMAALFAIHFLLNRALNSNLILLQLAEIYAFLTLLNIFHFIALRWLFIKWPTYAGLLFTALSFLKMLVCVLYLWPYIFPSNENSIILVFNFMAVYFITLTFEVIFIVKNIMHKQ